MPNVTFHGACGVVTGSCTQLDWGERQVLVDCGMYQGGEELEAAQPGPLPVPARGADGRGGHPRPPRPYRPAAAPGRGGLLRARLLHHPEPRADLARPPGRRPDPGGGGPLRPPEGLQPAFRSQAAVHRRGCPPGAQAPAAGPLRRGAGALSRRAPALRARRAPAGRGQRRDLRQGRGRRAAHLVLLGRRRALRRADPEGPRAAAATRRPPCCSNPPTATAATPWRTPRRPWAGSSRRPTPAAAW